MHARRLRNISIAILSVLLICGCAHITVDGVWEREPSNNAALCLMIPGGGQFCNEQPASEFHDASPLNTRFLLLRRNGNREMVLSSVRFFPGNAEGAGIETGSKASA